MGRYPMSAVERAMKVQEVLMRALGGQLKWWQAAEIIGVSERTMRRWRWRLEQHGYDGLFDRRCQRPSPKRVAVETVRKVLRLYQERYSGFNVRHFHEKLVEEQGITLSYEWVKTALQTAGLVKRRKKRGTYRRRRERRPVPGMLVFCDGSDHRWIESGDGEYQTLIAFIDDATNEVYAAYLAPEEGTLTVMAGLKEVIEAKGLFCSFYTDRGSHFFHTPKAGKAVDKEALTQIGRALHRLGIEHIPSYSPQGRGRMERFFGTWQGRLPNELRQRGIRTMEAANAYIRKVFIPWHNRKLAVPAKEEGDAFVPYGEADLDSILCIQHERIVQNDHTLPLGNRHLQIQRHPWRISFAKCRVTVCEHLDRTLSVRYGPRILGWYHNDGSPIEPTTSKKSVA